MLATPFNDPTCASALPVTHSRNKTREYANQNDKPAGQKRRAGKTPSTLALLAQQLFTQTQ
jgi:hypothetical protein